MGWSWVPQDVVGPTAPHTVEGAPWLDTSAVPPVWRVRLSGVWVTVGGAAVTVTAEAGTLDGLSDVDLAATPVEGATTGLVLDGTTWKRGTLPSGGASDLQAALVAPDGGVWVLTVGDDGALETTPADLVPPRP